MQAFDGIRVLDFTHVLAGPFCAYQLAVMGADVIKIEDPSEPDMMRPEGVVPDMNAAGLGSRFICQAGNKRSVAINLKSDAGIRAIHKLVETTDVVISNFRSGVMDRLGLGAETLQAIKPDLIYCAMSGFGATGPKSQHPAYDNVIQAFSGLMAATGLPEAGAVKVGPPVLDYGTGAQAAFAIAAALFQRSRTGRGQVIDVSMLDAALMLMSSSVTDTDCGDAPPSLTGNSSPDRAAYGLFETASGQLMIGAFTNRQLGSLWRAIGRDDMADAMIGKSTDDVVAQRHDDRALLAELFLARTADEWERDLNAKGVPAARVRNLHEALHEQQTASRRVLQPGLSVEGRPAPVATPVAAFGYATDGPSLTREPPRLGQHTDEVLREIGLSVEDLAAEDLATPQDPGET